jgi:hypothetical protein
MTDEQGTQSGPTGFTHGTLSDSVLKTAQAIEECFDEINLKKYRDGYRKLALSGTTGAMEALSKQQEGETTPPNTPVDMTRFLADTWLRSMANAWDATCDLTWLYQKDFSRYVGADTKSTEASSSQDDNPPPVPAENPATAPAGNAGAAPAPPNPGTGTERRWKGRREGR